MLPTQVKVQKNGKVKELSFTDCILDELDAKDEQLQVTLRYQNHCISISDSFTDVGNSIQECYTTTLKHSTRCPFHELTADEKKSIPTPTSNIKIAAAMLIQSSDNFILLTKRPSHMRTYPGVWVPPGGHLELQETLKAGVLRELNEEVGLNVEDLDDRMTVLGIWEAAYPDRGTPTRHHLVIYFNFVLNETREQLQKKLKLHPEEVAVSIWLDAYFVSTFLNTTNMDVLEKSIPFCEVTILNDKNVQTVSVKSIKELFAFDGIENTISTGTVFALKQWLELLQD